MSSIDKLAVTSRLLYDVRVLEQRREIEQLKMKLLFRDYRPEVMKNLVKDYNYWNTKCKCTGCEQAGRTHAFAEGHGIESAKCLFGPWFDEHLKKEGLVCLRQYSCVEEYDDNGNSLHCLGLYADDEDITCNEFAFNFAFSEEDCHLVEAPLNTRGGADSDPNVRWGRILIGKRLWGAKSTQDDGIAKFKKVFGNYGWITCRPNFAKEMADMNAEEERARAQWQATEAADAVNDAAAEANTA